MVPGWLQLMPWQVAGELWDAAQAGWVVLEHEEDG